MTKFDVVRLGKTLYVVVQAEHLLALNTVVLVPALPVDQAPALRSLTVDVEIDGSLLRIRAHMPLTVDGRSLSRSSPISRLSPDDGQKVMDALNTILWGF